MPATQETAKTFRDGVLERIGDPRIIPGYISFRTQMLRKLIGGEGSPCACNLIGASLYGLYLGVP